MDGVVGVVMTVVCGPVVPTKELGVILAMVASKKSTVNSLRQEAVSGRTHKLTAGSKMELPGQVLARNVRIGSAFVFFAILMDFLCHTDG